MYVFSYPQGMTRKFLPPTQTWDNPASSFMFMCFSFADKRVEATHCKGLFLNFTGLLSYSIVTNNFICFVSWVVFFFLVAIVVVFFVSVVFWLFFFFCWRFIVAFLCYEMLHFWRKQRKKRRTNKKRTHPTR